MENDRVIKRSNEVGSFIKAKRKEMNVTQEELAQFTSLSRVGIVKLEKVSGDMKLSTLIKVMGLLGFEIVLRKRTGK